MAPLMVIKDGKPRYALGLPGGLRIFTSALQAVINLIDHGMSLQEAVEAPRIWTQGFELELEPAFSSTLHTALHARGHSVVHVPRRRLLAGRRNAYRYRWWVGSQRCSLPAGNSQGLSLLQARWRH